MFDHKQEIHERTKERTGRVDKHWLVASWLINSWYSLRYHEKHELEISALEEKINHLQRKLPREIISLFGEGHLLRLRAMLQK